MNSCIPLEKVAHNLRKKIQNLCKDLGALLTLSRGIACPKYLTCAPTPLTPLLFLSILFFILSYLKFFLCILCGNGYGLSAAFVLSIVATK